MKVFENSVFEPEPTIFELAEKVEPTSEEHAVFKVCHRGVGKNGAVFLDIRAKSNVGWFYGTYTLAPGDDFVLYDKQPQEDLPGIKGPVSEDPMKC